LFLSYNGLVNMNKTDVINFLEAQLKEINLNNFDLDIFKSSVGNVMRLAFGDQSPHYKQVTNLSYLQKNSLEELYPKIVKDKVGTAEKAKQILSGLIQQIDLLSESEFKKIKNFDITIIKTIKQALQNNLTGLQIESLKNTVLQQKDTTLILEHLRRYDSESVMRILAEIITDKDIWD